MTTYRSYQHVELLREDNSEVDGLLKGHVIVQVKIDGTNGVMGWDGEKKEIWYGKRTQKLGDGDDNQGFKSICSANPNYAKFFERYPDVILFGEWLIPHTIKNYNINAWKKFYIFDIGTVGEDGVKYEVFTNYISDLEELELPYSPIYAEFDDPTIDQLRDLLPETHWMVSEGMEEGIVVKNYSYRNRYGQQTWGKIVNTNFKLASRTRDKGVPTSMENVIVRDLLTLEFCEKEYAKVLETHNNEFSPFLIPEILGRVKYEFVKDHISIILKKYRLPTVNFKNLYRELEIGTKQYLEL